MIVKNIVIREIDGGIKIDLKDADMNNTKIEDKISFILDKILMTVVKSDEFDKLLYKENLEVRRKNIWN